MHQKNSEITQLYNEYNDDLFSYGAHLGFEDEVVMDAIHDVFYRLCTGNRRLEDIENHKYYLFRALKNRLIDIYRSTKELQIESEPIDENKEFEDIPFHFNITVEDEIIQEEDLSEIRQKIESMLANLTNRQREAIYFRYIHEYEYHEIADIMQISIEACRNLISKSLERLKKLSLSALVFIDFISESTLKLPFSDFF